MEIDKAIENLCKGKTVIVVAHRLGALKMCNRVAVVENHSITSVGTHDEVRQDNAYYNQAWTDYETARNITYQLEEVQIMRENPLKKNSRFYLGMVLNVAEGMLSGFNFLLLYEAMKMLWNGTINSPSLLRLSLFLGGVFILRIVIYSIGYTQSQIGGAAVSNRTRLFLGDKIKRIPLSRFTQGQTGQYINIVTSDVNNYEKILTHTVGIF